MYIYKIGLPTKSVGDSNYLSLPNLGVILPYDTWYFG